MPHDTATPSQCTSPGSEPSIKLSLVIPCYNEQKTLKACVSRCLELINHDISLELIIVDDCSTDGSAAIGERLAETHPEILFLRHERNMGKGAALRTGFRHATGMYVGIQDADAEYQPLDYLELLKPLISKKADVVYGSRYLRQDTRRVLYFWHTWMNRSLTFISNMFTNLDITDMETCYKLFSRETLLKLIPHLHENRFGIEPEITSAVSLLRCRVYECAIHYNPRSYEEGKKIGWRDGIRALYCILHYGAPHAPLPMQILLYAIIGALCAIVNLLAFSCLFFWGLGLAEATVAAFIIAAASNYFLCIAILFQHKARRSGPGEVFVYILSVLCMCLIDVGVTLGLVQIGMSPIWSKTWATLIGFAGNFLFRKYLVF